MSTSKASTSVPMLTEIVLPGLVGPEGVIIHQRPVPTPGKGQALVEMLATGVSFAEQQMRRGLSEYSRTGHRRPMCRSL